jgi:hypothetical protein
MNRILTSCLALAAFASTAIAEGHAHDDNGNHVKVAEDHPGDQVALGAKTMGAWKVTVTRIGTWEPGKEGAASVSLAPDKPAAKAVRVWIGDEEGKSATKAKGEADSKQSGSWHCHVTVPNPIPEDAQLWVAIETGAGDKLKESFPLKSEHKAAEPAKEHKHDEHGHDHDHK